MAEGGRADALLLLLTGAAWEAGPVRSKPAADLLRGFGALGRGGAALDERAEPVGGYASLSTHLLSRCAHATRLPRRLRAVHRGFLVALYSFCDFILHYSVAERERERPRCRR